MRLKNKKILLGFLMLHTWCYGELTPEEITEYVKELQRQGFDMTSPQGQAQAAAFLQKIKGLANVEDRLEILKAATTSKPEPKKPSTDEIKQNTIKWLNNNFQEIVDTIKHTTYTTQLTDDTQLELVLGLAGLENVLQDKNISKHELRAGINAIILDLNKQTSQPAANARELTTQALELAACLNKPKPAPAP